MKNINKIIAVAMVIAVVLVVVGFFGGTLYQKSQTIKPGRNFGGPGGGGIGNFESQAANATRRSGGLQGGFTSGDIIARDNNSITLKLRDGSSRIIFYSGSTTINKQASGTVDDLSVGSSVMVVGNANADGSVSAQNISLRPAGAAGNPGGGMPGADGANGPQSQGAASSPIPPNSNQIPAPAGNAPGVVH